MDVLVRFPEQAFQRIQLSIVEPVQGAGGETFEQDVELLHPAPATPARPIEPHPPSHGAVRSCFKRASPRAARTSMPGHGAIQGCFTRRPEPQRTVVP